MEGRREPVKPSKDSLLKNPKPSKAVTFRISAGHLCTLHGRATRCGCGQLRCQGSGLFFDELVFSTAVTSEEEREVQIKAIRWSGLVFWRRSGQLTKPNVYKPNIHILSYVKPLLTIWGGGEGGGVEISSSVFRCEHPNMNLWTAASIGSYLHHLALLPGQPQLSPSSLSLSVTVSWDSDVSTERKT